MFRDDLEGNLGKKPVKSFKDCIFKLNLPKIQLFDNYIAVSSMLTYTVADPTVEVALYKAIFYDRIGNALYKEYTDKLIDHKTRSKAITCEIPLNGKRPGLLRSRLVLQILSSKQEIYQLEYLVDDTGKARFEGVSKATQTKEMEQKFEAISDEFYNTDEFDDETTFETEQGYSAVPEIEDLKKAVIREKCYLQEEGGRRYKVIDGKQLNIEGDQVTYVFDMESELFLADDAPLTLHVGTEKAAGSVIICEGFSITISVDKDFGEKINSAAITVEPWKLLEAQVKKLDSITFKDRIAMKVIHQGPLLVTGESIQAIRKGQDEVKNKVSTSDVTMVWGPPGTGKTYTMANIAIDYLKKNKTVLMVSHSNISVDGFVNQVVEQLSPIYRDYWLEAGKILRYGYVRDEKLSENKYAVAFNYVLEKETDLRESMKFLQEEKKELKEKDPHSEKMDKVEKALKRLRTEIRGKEREYVEEADMVAMTISKAVMDSLFEDKKYDLVMFDEVSMAYVTQIICAAKLAKEKFICVGDFDQLAPIAQSDAKKVLEKDIFSYMGIVDSAGRLHNHQWLVMLNEQRRMLPAISDFPNRYVYNNLLTNHPSVISKRSIAAKEPIPNEEMILIDLAGTYCTSDKNLDNSRYNILSAIIAFANAKQAYTGESKEEVGIITPYAAQTRLIGAMILDEMGKEAGNIACSTVHQFQGSERDTIIFDSVESFPGTKAGYLMSRNENRSLIRLINVAMTRARGKLMVQGNGQFWANAMRGKNNFFYQLFQYMQRNSFHVKHAETRTLDKMLMQLKYGKKIKYFNKADQAVTKLLLDMKKAKSKVVVLLPNSEIDVEVNKKLYNALLQLQRNGIEVYVKAVEYTQLSSEWKKLACVSENATSPLVVIDDSIIWYGLPVSEGGFKGRNNMSFVTVVPLYYRLNGKHAVDMIRSLTDIDMIQVDGIRKPLESGATGKEDKESGISSGGIHKYVQQTEKCCWCHNPMILTRSSRGKVYLKCSSGDREHTNFLEKSKVGEYIQYKRPRCPQCKSEITGYGVSKYGLWVRCANGHYPKVDEI